MFAEHEVCIFTRRAGQAEAICKKGITVRSGEGDFTARVQANIAEEAAKSKCRIYIIAVKQYKLEELHPVLSRLDPSSVLIFLQNGMGHLEFMESLPHKTIITGSVEHGAARISDTEVRHNGIGVTNVALYRGESTALDLASGSSIPNFPYTVHGDWRKMLEMKLLVNAAINPLTAVMGVENGGLIENPHCQSLFSRLICELSSVYTAYDKTELSEKIRGICISTRDNISSMKSDLDHGRRTEIEAILGPVRTKAQLARVRIPLTDALYELVKGMEYERGLRP